MSFWNKVKETAKKVTNKLNELDDQAEMVCLGIEVSITGGKSFDEGIEQVVAPAVKDAAVHAYDKTNTHVVEPSIKNVKKASDVVVEKCGPVVQATKDKTVEVAHTIKDSTTHTYTNIKDRVVRIYKKVTSRGTTVTTSTDRLLDGATKPSPTVAHGTWYTKEQYTVMKGVN
jgi:hypothetical protein